MSFPAEMLSPIWPWVGHLLYFPLLAWALWRAPWYHLKNSADTHILFASYVILYLLWHTRVALPIAPGLEFHFLLVTTLTLMFGWAFALLGVSLVQLALTAVGQAEWGGYSLNVLCNGVLPIGFTYYASRAILRWLPRHFFVYIFVGAFLVGGLALAVSRLAGMGILLAAEVYDPETLNRDYLFLLPVMMFPEAFLNGGIMTLLVAFRPHWVSSFRDDVYLRGK